MTFKIAVARCSPVTGVNWFRYAFKKWEYGNHRDLATLTYKPLSDPFSQSSAFKKWNAAYMEMSRKRVARSRIRHVRKMMVEAGLDLGIPKERTYQLMADNFHTEILGISFKPALATYRTSATASRSFH
jgi:hypothetical protein